MSKVKQEKIIQTRKANLSSIDVPLPLDKDAVGIEIRDKVLGQRDDLGFDRDGSELWIPGREGTVLESLVGEWWEHQVCAL